jgi:hypothetical protein
MPLVSADAERRRDGEPQGVSTRSTPQSPPVDSHAYAESLYRHAAFRLDAFSLRCWIIRRLMFDLGLDHGRAEDLFEDVHAAGVKAGSARTFREAHREPHHASIRELRRSVHNRRRHLHPHR